MPADPFLVLPVRGKKEVLALRQKARLVAQLLRYEPHEQACIAAGAFAVACQAQGQLGKARICFFLEHDHLHIVAQGLCEADAVPHEEQGPAKPLLRLTKPLPREKGLAEMDIAWLVRSLEHRVGNLFEEIIKQNQEVLSLLHELQVGRAFLVPSEEMPKNPSAA